MSMFDVGLVNNNPVKVTAVADPGSVNQLHYDASSGGYSDADLQKLLISWTKPCNSTPSGYNVYGSLSPLSAFSNKLNTTPIDPVDSPAFTYVPPIIPLTLVYYFWVTTIDDAGVEKPLFAEPASIESGQNFNQNPLTPSSTFPATTQINDNMKFVAEEIRRRHQFMIENDGELAEIYLRRWSGNPPYGTPCGCTDDDPNDSSFQGSSTCAECFGTGIRGGFYPKITIRFRYSEMPVRGFTFGKRGIELDHPFGTWMLWAPKIRDHDLLVRLKTGERFEITDPAASEWRSVLLHQRFKVEALPQTDIRQQVSNGSIAKALKLDETAGFIKQGWQVFK